MNGMKIKKAGLILLTAGMVCVTGCGSTLPELSEEDNAKVVEYASGLLLKYDKNTKSRLVDDETAPEAEQETEQQTAEAAPSEAEPSEAAPAQESKEETVQEVVMTMEEVLGFDHVSFTYAGYEIKDKYPDKGETDLYMAMSATPSYKLLVLNFDVTSLTGEEASLDMLSSNAKIKFLINGENERYVLTTMLLDDLANYNGPIAANEATRLVLVGEVAEGSVNDIQSLQLSVSKGEDKTYITLQ